MVVVVVVVVVVVGGSSVVVVVPFLVDVHDGYKSSHLFVVVVRCVVVVVLRHQGSGSRVGATGRVLVGLTADEEEDDDDVVIIPGGCGYRVGEAR